MSNPLGRFEFRTWGNHLGPIRDQIAQIAPPAEPRESAESYILSRTTDAANAKIRAGLMDIKLMTERVSRLERWRPVLKDGFPIDSRTIVEQVFPSLGVATPHIERPSYEYAEFIRDLIRPHRDLALVEVTKTRWQFTLKEYTAEFAEVGIGGGASSQTVAIESDDPAAVLRAIAKLGLNSHSNINYVRHLKLMIGMTPRPSASTN
jgi:exopolyphosphatase / guanosine-5'-triphosphate,3'-diphosphate pyrophosphatase